MRSCANSSQKPPRINLKEKLFFVLLWHKVFLSFVMMKIILCLILFILPVQAKSIDALIDSKAKRKPALIDDLGFLRRLMLVAGGRIPTLEEIKAYEKTPKAIRKKKWIDKILNSEAHVSHQYNYWADVLRVTSRFRGIQLPQADKNYSNWIKDALREGRPFDEMVQQLISAKGSLFEEGNGAVGYYLRDKGMPLDNMSNTMRIFAGTRMECAQCHDHPFEKWKQKEFYQLAAFTHSSFKNQGNRSKTLAPLREDFKEMRKKGNLSDEEFKSIKRIRDLLSAEVDDTGAGVISLPKDYAYDDGDPGDILVANTPMGPTIKEQPKEKKLGKKAKKRFKNKPEQLYDDIDSRTHFAKWLTSPEHPRFTRVIVNRIWKQAFGKAITEPLDDIKEDTVSQHPELEEHLIKRMIELKYDLRAFWKEILLTRAFSRESVIEDHSKEEPYDFRAPISRRMSGSAWWDSLMTLAKGTDVDKLSASSVPLNHIYEELTADPNTSVDKIRDFMKLTMKASRESFGIWIQVRSKVHMMDMPEKEKVRLKNELDKALNLSEKASSKRLDEIRRELAVKLSKEDDTMMMSGKKRKFQKNTQRRSELSNKLYGGHFIRTFGGSDRETIDGANTQASIPQALRLLNGSNEGMLINPNQALGKVLRENSKKPVKVKAEIIFLSILGRRPTSTETKLIIQDVEKRKGPAMADWVWVLLNSHEFRKV